MREQTDQALIAAADELKGAIFTQRRAPPAAKLDRDRSGLGGCGGTAQTVRPRRQEHVPGGVTSQLLKRGSGMARQSIAKSKLSAWIQAELDKQEDCAGVVFEGRFESRQSNGKECNWALAGMSEPQQYSAECRQHLRDVLRQAEQLFNLVF